MKLMNTRQNKQDYLEFDQLGLGDGIRLGDDGDDVHLALQLLHAHQIQ